MVVTREQTSGRGPYRGLPWQLHVTLATAAHTPHGWGHRSVVTADMTRALRTGILAVAGLTLLGALAAVLDPSFGPSTRPHPTLTPGLAVAVSLWQSNLRVLAAPFLLAGLRFADTRLGRTAGDVIVAAITAYSTVTVGLALGRWGGTLVPYLPHLPLEWAALSASVARGCWFASTPLAGPGWRHWPARSSCC